MISVDNPFIDSPSELINIVSKKIMSENTSKSNNDAEEIEKASIQVLWIKDLKLVNEVGSHFVYFWKDNLALSLSKNMISASKTKKSRHLH